MKLRNLILAAAVMVSSVAAAVAQTPIKVLFVGNSYTICNGSENNPEIAVKLMALAAINGTPMKYDAFCSGGKNLEWHWENGAKEVIENGNYDYVVLQDQSAGTVNAPDDFMKFSEKFGELIKSKGGVPVFYMTPAYANRQSMIDTISMMYNKAAKATGGRVAPCGLAWKIAYDKYPDLRLHTKDNSHAAAPGIFINVYTFYQTIFGHKSNKIVQYPIGLDKNWFKRLEKCSSQAIRENEKLINNSF